MICGQAEHYLALRNGRPDQNGERRQNKGRSASIEEKRGERAFTVRNGPNLRRPRQRILLDEPTSPNTRHRPPRRLDDGANHRAPRPGDEVELLRHRRHNVGLRLGSDLAHGHGRDRPGHPELKRRKAPALRRFAFGDPRWNSFNRHAAKLRAKCR